MGAGAGPRLRGLSAGPQEAEGIAEWLRRRVGSSATRLEEEEGAQALIDAQDVVVIGFFQVSWKWCQAVGWGQGLWCQLVSQAQAPLGPAGRGRGHLPGPGPGCPGHDLWPH